MLSNYYKNLKTVSKISHNSLPGLSQRITYIFGNQSNDPDSVFGSTILSLMLFIHFNKILPQFAQNFKSLVDDNLSDTQLNNMLGGNDYQVWIPFLDADNSTMVSTKLEIQFPDELFDVGISGVPDRNILSSLTISPENPLKLALFDHNYPSQEIIKLLIKKIGNDKIIEECTDTGLIFEGCYDHHSISN